ncbi:hypothetical protein SmJEL517_g01789 [Synchytrium microbalum]|uniref:phenylalanine 4-monooxygenase n=1 Tax=Synchytrium microbalum TaxID=1806994 RepID=A0A507C9S2_9FUNG|nr:uncharacterized protein SmJEL517_g01789 [Synchytrium microbalum]TPX35919.1 hypothetical protein SmJEL517_g01789 [Synchytrium microbalum]
MVIWGISRLISRRPPHSILLSSQTFGSLLPQTRFSRPIGSTLRWNSNSINSAGSATNEAKIAQQPTTLWFSISDKVGSLDDVLFEIRRLNVSLTSIESRPSRNRGEYDFVVDFVAADSREVDNVVTKLKDCVKGVKVVSSGSKDSETTTLGVPWFPRKITDLDQFADRVLSYGAELDADHPGFKDLKYRERRAEITRLAREFRHGGKLPHIEYTPDEVKTWGVIFDGLTKLYPTHAVREVQYVLPLLVQNCGYRNDNIPQLEDVSNFLKDCTGWTLRPVMGLLSSRDFLNSLAFRVFNSTQYMRHTSQPFYTPEPDVCHELLGHVPLYADPDFADFSQEIGLASLGATDEDINKLATIYWFTVEFGLCRQGDEVKAFGAGLLSSFGELEYCLTDKPEKRPFDPLKTAVQKYPITEYQPVYYVAESFSDMKELVKDYSLSLERPFAVRYSALTQSIEVLNTKSKIVRFGKTIIGDLAKLIAAVEKY